MTVPIKSTASLGFNLLVHLQDIGGMWFQADQFAGTRGRQIEEFQISFKPAVPGLRMQYFAHVQDHGDTAWSSDGQFVGTRDEGRRIEGFAIRLTGPSARNYDVEYTAYVQDKGDQPLAKNGEFCGTRGGGLRVESMRIRIVKRRR